MLQLTHDIPGEVGFAFYSTPLNNSNGNLSNSNFSTTFVFVIAPKYADHSGDGMAFALTSSGLPDMNGAHCGEGLGLFSRPDTSNSTISLAVEFDTFKNDGNIQDMDNNHVGIDINYSRSVKAESAKYYDDIAGRFRGLKLTSRLPMQAWIDYVGEKELSVTIAPLHTSRPKIPLLVHTLEVEYLWRTLPGSLFVGFSAATASGTASHYVLGWGFSLNGEATLEVNDLPLPPWLSEKSFRNVLLKVCPPLIVVSVLFLSILAFFAFKRWRRHRRKMNFDDILEDWELEYGPHRISYEELLKATDNFNNENIIGRGGLGNVYKGVLTTTSQYVAVKRVNQGPRQGMKEFVEDIVSTGRLRHWNLVQLHGYCRRRGELLLVYDFMPNGSLDRYLFTHALVLNWTRRFAIIKDVAAGLLYLREGWDKVVVHRDIKAGNVLLSGDFNGILGDFGLSKCYNYGGNPQTTSVVGTFGYLAPEVTKTGKPTTKTDIYAFGSLLLSGVCGRKPTSAGKEEDVEEGTVLADYVRNCWQRRTLTEIVDMKMNGNYVMEEVEMVLQLGLLCSHPDPAIRPSIRQIVGLLEGSVKLPQMTPANFGQVWLTVQRLEGFDELLRLLLQLPVTETVGI